MNEQKLCSKPWQPLLAGRSNNHMSRTAGESFPQGWIPTISIHMNGPRTSHQVGTQQSKETARRSRSSFGLYHGQRRSPVETHRKSLLQEEGSRADRSFTPSGAMTASFTERVFCIKSWHNSQGIVGSCVRHPGWCPCQLDLAERVFHVVNREVSYWFVLQTRLDPMLFTKKVLRHRLQCRYKACNFHGLNSFNTENIVYFIWS